MSNFDPDWTEDQAIAADEAARAADPTRPTSDPTLPFSRWAGAQKLAELHRQHDAGDRFALMAALRECARCGMAMPDWVAAGYIKAHDMVLNYRAKSWDEAFGRPIPKGAHLNALRRRRQLRHRVWGEVFRAMRANPGRPIDKGLFEEIAERLGIGATYCEELYRQAVAFGSASAIETRPDR